MKHIGDTVLIGHIKQIEPNGDLITLTEEKGTKVCMTLGTILRCHAVAQNYFENAGMDWDAERQRILAQEGTYQEILETNPR